MVDINFIKKEGDILFDNLHISSDHELEKHLDELKEDMLQVAFPEGYLLDIGWYPSFDIKGNFQVMVVKDYNWSYPVFKGSANDINDLKSKIYTAWKIIKKAAESHKK